MKTKKIKQNCLLMALILICSLFISCIDYVQGISVVNNKIVTNFKVTISKLLLDQTGEDGSELFQELDDIKELLPENSVIKKYDNDVDIGFHIKYSIDIDTEDQNEIMLLPFIDDKTEDRYYPFIIGQDADIFEELLYAEGDEELQSIMLMFLASAKCRYIISKELEPRIKKAYFTADDEILELPVYDYGDSFGIEIPLITLAMGRNEGLNMDYICVH